MTARIVGKLHDDDDDDEEVEHVLIRKQNWMWKDSIQTDIRVWTLTQDFPIWDAMVLNVSATTK